MKRVVATRFACFTIVKRDIANRALHLECGVFLGRVWGDETKGLSRTTHVFTWGLCPVILLCFVFNDKNISNTIISQCPERRTVIIVYGDRVGGI